MNEHSTTASLLTQDRATETVAAPHRRPTVQTNHGAFLVHIYPTNVALGARYFLADQAVLLGRDEDCTIQIPEKAVSRHHARIEPRSDGYYAVDLKSTNGTWVNDRPAYLTRLKDGDSLRVGTNIYRFLDGGNVEAEYHEVIYRLAITDGLTGIPNKRAFLEFLERELSRSVRYRRPLSLMMLDIDHFKQINDRLGHLAGDAVLRDMASCIREDIRREELFARYGGEEFALVVPEASVEQALEMAERLRRRVEEYPFRYDGNAVPVTVSIGLATTSGEPPMSGLELIARADEKLYQAKQAGRNRVVA